MSFYFIFYKLDQAESHSRNISRKSSLKSIPESEEEEEDDDKCEIDDILTNNKKDTKISDNQYPSKAHLNIFPCSKSFVPRTPPVVQVLSPGASTPNKSFPSEKSNINSCSELDSCHNPPNETTKNDTSDIASLRSDVCTLTYKVPYLLKIYMLNDIYISSLVKVTNEMSILLIA